MFRKSNTTWEQFAGSLRWAWTLLKGLLRAVLDRGNIQRIIDVLRLILDFMEFVLRRWPMGATV